MARDSKKKRELTDKQERFCQHYTTHWNATRAAKEAGYSEASAKEQGFQLLHKTLLQERISELTGHALKEIGITRERVLLEYGRLAFFDISDAYDEIGQLKPIKEMPEDVRRAVLKIKVFEKLNPDGDTVIGFNKEIEFAQRKAALDSISKCLGMAPDKVEHSGPGGKPIETVNKSDLTEAELDARIRLLLSSGSDGEE